MNRPDLQQRHHVPGIAPILCRCHPVEDAKPTTEWRATPPAGTGGMRKRVSEAPRGHSSCGKGWPDGVFKEVNRRTRLLNPLTS